MIRSFKPYLSLFKLSRFGFTGKTETGHKFTTPILKLKGAKPVPPPGQNIQIPEDWTVEKFCEKIGGDMYEHADKFESVEEIFKIRAVTL